MPERVFYRSPSADPAFNLALEEVLLESGAEGMMFWRSTPAVLTGVHQVTAAEVRIADACNAGIPVLRRTTGGGTVYVDSGTLNFSIFTEVCPWSPDRAQKLLFPILNTLQTLHWNCTLSGRNDILCGGVKISGTARRNLRGRMLLHGTLLYDTDLEKLVSLLTPDPVKLRSKGIASVRSRVGDLRAMAADAPDMAGFCRMMTAGLCRQTGLPEPVLPEPALLEAAAGLAETRYHDPGWNFGTSFPCTYSRTGHFPGGTVTAEVEVIKHRITAVRLTGDFFAERPAEELTAALTGLPPEYEAVAGVLQRLNADGFIAGVSGRELAELLAPHLCFADEGKVD